jgi:ferredoxin
MNSVKLAVEGYGEFEVPLGKKLVLALKEDVGVEQLHACGGKARCTTCKVQFIDSEPNKITQAEKNILSERGIKDLRLSCQINCDQNYKIKLISLLEGSGRADCGSIPPAEIIPEPVWEDLNK